MLSTALASWKCEFLHDEELARAKSVEGLQALMDGSAADRSCHGSPPRSRIGGVGRERNVFHGGMEEVVEELPTEEQHF